MTDQTTPVLELGVPVVLAFSHQRIADLVTACVEGGMSTEWLTSLKLVPSPEAFAVARQADRSHPWYSVGALYATPGFQAVATVDKPTKDHPGEVTLTLEDFQRALILMATKDKGAYARHFGDFLGENEDVNTADLFMQLAVYGEEVYA